MKEATKEVLRDTGFSREVDLVEEGRCPKCEEVVVVGTAWAPIERYEFSVSGLCRECQAALLREEKEVIH